MMIVFIYQFRNTHIENQKMS